MREGESHSRQESVVNWGRFRAWESFPGGRVVKNPPINAADVGSIPGSRRFTGEGNGSPLPFHGIAWKIPWTEEPDGLQSMGSQRAGHSREHMHCPAKGWKMVQCV